MAYLPKIQQLAATALGVAYVGMQSLKKVFSQDGSVSAFLSVSKLDLDTDGAKVAGIKYESTFQGSTALGDWVNSNEIPYVVVPGDWKKSHGGLGASRRRSRQL
jgi:hypothetical protein